VGIAAGTAGWNGGGAIENQTRIDGFDGTTGDEWVGRAGVRDLRLVGYRGHLPPGRPVHLDGQRARERRPRAARAPKAVCQWGRTIIAGVRVTF